MVTLEFPFVYNDYINPYFRPLKPHLCNWALEIERRSVIVKVWVIVWEVWGLKLNSRILLSNKFFKVSKTWKSLLKWLFDKLFCVKPVLTNFSQFIELHETNFSSWLWRTHFRLNLKKYLSELNGTIALWSRSENLSYELKLIFSSFCRNFIDRAWIWGCSAHVHQI